MYLQSQASLFTKNSCNQRVSILEDAASVNKWVTLKKYYCQKLVQNRITLHEIDESSK